MSHSENNTKSNLIIDGVAGALSGLVIIIIATAIAALIFKGTLLPYFAVGITCALCGSIILNCITAGFSTFEIGIARIEPAIGVIIGLMFTNIASQQLASTILFPTLIAAMCITSLVVGIAMVLLGTLHLGQVARFLPYPVLGGVIASTAWIMGKESLVLIINNASTFTEFVQHHNLYQLFAGIGFAIIVVIARRKFTQAWILPAAIIIATLIIHLTLKLNHISHQQAINVGWLYTASKPIYVWQETNFSAFAQVNWSVILAQTNYILSLVCLLIIILLLNVSSLEVSVQERANLDRELKIAGIGNIFAGLLASVPANLSLTGTILNKNAGATSRIAGFVASLTCLLVLLLYPEAISYLPKPIIGGLLLFLAISLLIEWLYEGWFKLPHIDYSIVVMILLTVMIWGFLPGIVVGIIITCMVFIIRYARTETIKFSTSGENYHSNVVRPLYQEEWLTEKSGSIQLFKLQGYLFFGSAKLMFDKVETLLAEDNKSEIKFLIFDFQAVNGIDSSASFSYLRLQQLLCTRDITLIFTNCSEQILMQFKQLGVVTEQAPIIFQTLDQGMEWCENQLLDTLPNSQKPHDSPINATLDELIPDSEQCAIFKKYLQRITLPANFILIKQGDFVDCLYFIDSGEVAVYLEKDETNIRLTKSGAGTIVGEIGFYLRTSRTATVHTETPCVIYKLTYDALTELEKKHPDIAAMFHKSVIYVLATRVIHTNYELQLLSQ